MTDARRMLGAATGRWRGVRDWELTKYGELQASARGCGDPPTGWLLDGNPIDREVARLILAGLVLVPVWERWWNALKETFRECESEARHRGGEYYQGREHAYEYAVAIMEELEE